MAAAAGARPVRSRPRPTSSSRPPAARRADQRHDQRQGQVGDDRVRAAAALRGRRRARRGDVHAARRGRRRRACWPRASSRRWSASATARATARRPRSPRRSRSRVAPRSARVAVISDTDGQLVTRSAATGPAPTVGDVAISDASIERDPVTLTWKRSAGTTSAILFSPDDGDSWRPLAFRVAGESFVGQPGDAGRHGSGPLRGRDHGRPARRGRAAHRRHRERVQRGADGADHVAAGGRSVALGPAADPLHRGGGRPRPGARRRRDRLELGP